MESPMYKYSLLRLSTVKGLTRGERKMKKSWIPFLMLLWSLAIIIKYNLWMDNYELYLQNDADRMNQEL